MRPRELEVPPLADRPPVAREVPVEIDASAVQPGSHGQTVRVQVRHEEDRSRRRTPPVRRSDRRGRAFGAVDASEDEDPSPAVGRIRIPSASIGRPSAERPTVTTPLGSDSRVGRRFNHRSLEARTGDGPPSDACTVAGSISAGCPRHRRPPPGRARRRSRRPGRRPRSASATHPRRRGARRGAGEGQGERPAAMRRPGASAISARPRPGAAAAPRTALVTSNVRVSIGATGRRPIEPR